MGCMITVVERVAVLGVVELLQLGVHNQFFWKSWDQAHSILVLVLV